MAKREHGTKWSSGKFRLHQAGGFEFIHVNLINVSKPPCKKENQLKSSTGSGQGPRLTAYLPSAFTPSSDPPGSTHVLPGEGNRWTWEEAMPRTQRPHSGGSSSVQPPSPSTTQPLPPQSLPFPRVAAHHWCPLWWGELESPLWVWSACCWLPDLDIWSMLDSQQPLHAADIPPAWPKDIRPDNLAWRHLDTT